MSKQTMTCGKCGYIYWIDNVSWSVIPPDMNCPNCFPAVIVNTSYSGRAINERSEESAVDKFLKGDGAIQAERTRIIKALEGKLEEYQDKYDTVIGDLDKSEEANDYAFAIAIYKEAIKAVEKGNK